MKTFTEWLKSEGYGDFLPNMGQQSAQTQAVPQVQQQQPQAKQISLGKLSSSINNTDWQSVYNTFTRQYRKAPNDPTVSKMGQALYQSAMTKNFNLLQPYKQQTQQIVP